MLHPERTRERTPVLEPIRLPDAAAARVTTFWPAVILAFLVGIVVGVAPMVVGSFITSDAEAFVDDLTVAWSEGDAQAIRDLYADDAILTTSDGTTVEGAEAIVALSQEAATTDLRVERIGEVQEVSGHDAVRIDYESTAGAGTYLTVLRVVDGKIQMHQDFEA